MVFFVTEADSPGKGQLALYSGGCLPKAARASKLSLITRLVEALVEFYYCLMTDLRALYVTRLPVYLSASLPVFQTSA